VFSPMKCSTHHLARGARRRGEEAVADVPAEFDDIVPNAVMSKPAVGLGEPIGPAVAFAFIRLYGLMRDSSIFASSLSTSRSSVLTSVSRRSRGTCCKSRPE